MFDILLYFMWMSIMFDILWYFTWMCNMFGIWLTKFNFYAKLGKVHVVRAANKRHNLLFGQLMVSLPWAVHSILKVVGHAHP